jgi:hypothetical protein
MDFRDFGGRLMFRPLRTFRLLTALAALDRKAASERVYKKLSDSDFRNCNLNKFGLHDFHRL